MIRTCNTTLIGRPEGKVNVSFLPNGSDYLSFDAEDVVAKDYAWNVIRSYIETGFPSGLFQFSRNADPVPVEPPK